MKHFNEEQIKELSEIFGISPVQVLHNTSKNQFSKLVKIKDGVVDITTPTKIWWRCHYGPQQIEADSIHSLNIVNYPHLYSFEKPKFIATYD